MTKPKPAKEDKRMTTKYIINYLERYNEWRRYDGDIDKSPSQPNAIKLGKVIDCAIERLKEDK